MPSKTLNKAGCQKNLLFFEESFELNNIFFESPPLFQLSTNVLHSVFESMMHKKGKTGLIA